MKEEPLRKTKIILDVLILFGILTTIGIIIYVKVSEYKEEQHTNSLKTALNELVEVPSTANDESNDENKLSELEVVEIDMPEKMGDYEVIGEIEIPKINLKKYILDHYTKESMDLSATRFWGNEINEAGNFSIIGHNYYGHFRDLKDLEVGDTFTLTDKKGRICTYVIYDTFIVEPDDVSCIEDTLIGQREVTLITCTTGGKKRLILKGKEQK